MGVAQPASNNKSATNSPIFLDVIEFITYVKHMTQITYKNKAMLAIYSFKHGI